MQNEQCISSQLFSLHSEIYPMFIKENLRLHRITVAHVRSKGPTVQWLLTTSLLDEVRSFSARILRIAERLIYRSPQKFSVRSREFNDAISTTLTDCNQLCNRANVIHNIDYPGMSLFACCVRRVSCSSSATQLV